ncbi:MAG: hypothetical protein ABSF26_03230 [Thermoguttaceae bacterium]|jgi:hypothetical protein
MAHDLIDYLADKEPGKFTPRPHYSRDADSLTFFFRGDDAVAKRVDDLLTVYVSVETDELVGAKIKGIKRVLSTLGDFGVTIKDEGLTLGMLFLACMAVSRESVNKSEYIRLGEFVKSVPFDASELQPA